MGDPILTPIAIAAGNFFAAIKPVIDEHYIQLYDGQNRERVQAATEAVLLVDDSERRNSLNRVVQQLFDVAAVARGCISTTSIEVPLSDFLTLYQLASKGVADSQKLARVEFKL